MDAHTYIPMNYNVHPTHNRTSKVARIKYHPIIPSITYYTCIAHLLCYKKCCCLLSRRLKRRNIQNRWAERKHEEEWHNKIHTKQTNKPTAAKWTRKNNNRNSKQQKQHITKITLTNQRSNAWNDEADVEHDL